MKISSITAVILILFYIFIPSSTQLYAIYGIGGTIDYLKENKEAEKIPDNILKAANTFLENYTKEQQEK